MSPLTGFAFKGISEMSGMSGANLPKLASFGFQALSPGFSKSLFSSFKSTPTLTMPMTSPPPSGKGGCKCMDSIEIPKPSPGTSGRLRAIDYTSKFPKGTVGHVVNQSVSNATKLLMLCKIDPEFASSSIGKHYQEDVGDDFMNQPATDENLFKLAKGETDWWRQQSGSAWVIGGGTPACVRDSVLRCTRDRIDIQEDK